MKRTSIIAGIGLTIFILSSCKKEPAPEMATPAVPAAKTAPATNPALAAAANPVIDFDMRGFAGSFVGTLPCNNCPGNDMDNLFDTRIVLAGDGTYTLDETYQSKPNETVKGDGNWASEDNGHRLRLDPNSKSEEDHLFEVIGKNEIRVLSKDSTPKEGKPNFSLKRISSQ